MLVSRIDSRQRLKSAAQTVHTRLKSHTIKLLMDKGLAGAPLLGVVLARVANGRPASGSAQECAA
ncbi:hypothetical protein BDD14_4914 [Edaphobacter modestus]|uniref:Uncharacterized protein n=1 Tax=Edaphobacter modestus TaxID=388466 RepID=A0A4Q7YZ39_9BACT|nr:hypothetical protein BDD14_4914 [Edaphobacter modestus]